MSGSTARELTDVSAELEPFRRELTGYCYRMLGSISEAEDAVQETMVRAWRAYDGFEGRSALRSWVYRIATNVCLDAIKGRQRRAMPMDFGPAGSVDAPLAPPRPEVAWLEPVPDDQVLPTGGDPAEVIEARETIRLAFVAMLQHLPPRQRAVLILREVLRWHADEVAELLDTTVASVNSALQRARATLAEAELTESEPYRPMDAEQQALLRRYLEAFERYDMDSLTALLHEDATQSMPPYELWLAGRADLLRWWVGPGADCRGSRLVPLTANGAPAFGQYRPSGPNGRHEPWSIHVLDVVDDRIANITFFLDTTLFETFGLPPHLD